MEVKKVIRGQEGEGGVATSASPIQFSDSESPCVSRMKSTSGSPVITSSPMKKAMESIKGYLEQVGHFTKLDPQDAWLPITESRNGNAYYSAFHTLSSGIGFQALVLPLAFVTLQWLHTSYYIFKFYMCAVCIYTLHLIIYNLVMHGVQDLGYLMPLSGFHMAALYPLVADSAPRIPAWSAP